MLTERAGIKIYARVVVKFLFKYRNENIKMDICQGSRMVGRIKDFCIICCVQNQLFLGNRKEFFFLEIFLIDQEVQDILEGSIKNL